MRLLFETLKRPSDRLEGLAAADVKHAYWKFLSRLPDVPCAAWTADSHQDLEKGLGELARQLGRRTDRRDRPVALPRWLETAMQLG